MNAVPPPTIGPTEHAKPSKVIGRYALYAEIATGGMATVYLGRLLGPVGFSRTVAIKRLHQQYAKDPEFTTGFLDEARLAARIRHPNVVPTLDVVALEGELFLVMEYVQGESLSYLAKTAFRSKDRVPVAIAASIVSGLLQGLHAAHEAHSERGDALGIVHRDVSPQNVLVGIDGVARVLDFGIAKAVGRLQSTREGQIKGKLAYMAPEQVTAGPVSRQSDLFAASIILWELLTGRRLFRGDNEAETLYNVLQGQMVPPSKYAHGIPAAVDAVVMHGLERDRSKRYATAREMAVALEKAAPMVTAREVGEWVERIAGDKLRKRAQQLAEIEMLSADGLRVSSRPPPALSSRQDDMTTPPRSPDDSLADAMPTGGTTSRTLSRPGFVVQRRSLFAVIAALAALGLLAVGWVAFSSSQAPAPEASARSTSAEPPAPAAMGAPAPSTEQTAEPAETNAPPAPSAEASAPSVEAPAAATPRRRPARSSKSRPTTNDKGAKQPTLYSRE